MENIKDGGPAFPIAVEYCQDLTLEQCRGISLRDYFACRALSMISECHNPEETAKWCYRYANAMLAEREKP